MSWAMRRLDRRRVDELLLLKERARDGGRHVARALEAVLGLLASARITIASSSGGTSRAKVDGGSTTPAAHRLEQAVAAEAAVSGRAGESSCKMTPSA